MSGALTSQTSPSLLGRLRQTPTDQPAWNAFVERYGPKIYGWCRQWGLQESDAEDVTQIVLSKLAATMRDFAYDPSRSFRGWLKTLTHHAWSDFRESQWRAGAGSGDSQVLQMLQMQEARDDLLTRLEEEFDLELLEEAMLRARLRVAPSRWEVFRLTAVEGLSGAETAARLGLRVAMVFKYRSDVQKLVRDEVHKLEACGGTAAEDPP